MVVVEAEYVYTQVCAHEIIKTGANARKLKTELAVIGYPYIMKPLCLGSTMNGKSF